MESCLNALSVKFALKKFSFVARLELLIYSLQGRFKLSCYALWPTLASFGNIPFSSIFIIIFGNLIFILSRGLNINRRSTDGLLPNKIVSGLLDPF